MVTITVLVFFFYFANIIPCLSRQHCKQNIFEWTTKSLLWYPFQFVGLKATLVTPDALHGAVIPSNLHIPVDSAVAHSQHTRLEQFVFWCEKSCMFLWAKIGPDFTEHFTCRLYIKTETFWAHVLNSVCWTTSVCELLQIVNFGDFWVLTSLVLANSSNYLKCSEKDSDWFIVAFFIRVVSMLTTLCLLLK